MSGRFPPLRFARNQVGAGSPTISANNLQSQKPALSGYYGQSIGHDISRLFSILLDLGIVSFVLRRRQKTRTV
jgi:hypothetical protein